MMEQKLLGDLHFRFFLDLTFADPTPDEKTIWHYRERLNEAGVILELFEKFDAQLLEQELIVKDGIIVDATIVPAPKQHFTKAEKETIERNETPESWKEKPAIGRQRDTDAKWTRKNNNSFFGYKNHIKIDRGSTSYLRRGWFGISIHSTNGAWNWGRCWPSGSRLNCRASRSQRGDMTVPPTRSFGGIGKPRSSNNRIS